MLMTSSVRLILTLTSRDRFEKEMYEEWLAGVDEACSFNLNQPLISRNEESKLISVNFDPQLIAVLREVALETT